MVTSTLEHKAVLEPVGALEQRGFTVTRIGADSDGVVDPDELLAAVGTQTGLVSLMHVNNETGRQGVRRGRAPADRPDQRLRAQGARAEGHWGADRTAPRVRRPPPTPLMVGGGQQRGLRPGTLPVHLIAGFGTAARLAASERQGRATHHPEFRERALAALAPLAPQIDGDPLLARCRKVLNVSLPGIDAEAAIVTTKDLMAVSNGSACTSQSYEASHVLTAMGLGEQRVSEALRLSWANLTADPNWPEIVGRLQALKTT